MAIPTVDTRHDLVVAGRLWRKVRGQRNFLFFSRSLLLSAILIAGSPVVDRLSCCWWHDRWVFAHFW